MDAYDVSRDYSTQSFAFPEVDAKRPSTPASFTVPIHPAPVTASDAFEHDSAVFELKQQDARRPPSRASSWADAAYDEESEPALDARSPVRSVRPPARVNKEPRRERKQQVAPSQPAKRYQNLPRPVLMLYKEGVPSLLLAHQARYVQNVCARSLRQNVLVTPAPAASGRGWPLPSGPAKLVAAYMSVVLNELDRPPVVHPSHWEKIFVVNTTPPSYHAEHFCCANPRAVLERPYQEIAQKTVAIETQSYIAPVPFASGADRPVTQLRTYEKFVAQKGSLLMLREISNPVEMRIFETMLASVDKNKWPLVLFGRFVKSYCTFARKFYTVHKRDPSVNHADLVHIAACLIRCDEKGMWDMSALDWDKYMENGITLEALTDIRTSFLPSVRYWYGDEFIAFNHEDVVEFEPAKRVIKKGIEPNVHWRVVPAAEVFDGKEISGVAAYILKAAVRFFDLVNRPKRRLNADGTPRCADIESMVSLLKQFPASTDDMKTYSPLSITLLDIVAYTVATRMTPAFNATFYTESYDDMARDLNSSIYFGNIFPCTNMLYFFLNMNAIFSNTQRPSLTMTVASESDTQNVLTPVDSEAW